MSNDHPEVEVVSLYERTVTLRDGTVLPITEFLDVFGEDCEPIDAVVCIAGTDEFGWLDIEIFPPETVH